MKLSNTLSKKLFRFFYLSAAVMFFANDAFAAQTVTKSTPATGAIFKTGTTLPVNAAVAGLNGSISKIDFILTPLTGQADFNGTPHTVTFNASTLTADTIYAVTGLNYFWNVFLSARYE